VTLKFSKELEIEEPNIRDLKLIEPGYDEIELSNKLGSEVDSTILANHMGSVVGIDQIQTLTINYSSLLKDLKIIKAFPNLRNINVFGKQIASLEGLEWFHQGEYININTDSNRRRRITKISEAPIKRMILEVARTEDLDDISQCSKLNYLDLFRSNEVEFSNWSNIPLESIGLKQGKFKEIGNTVKIMSLKKMRVLGCRNLERFVGDNSRITWMIIEGCKKLDLRTIKTFQGIEVLIVNGNLNEIGLTEIGELKQLKSISLIDCNVQVDILKLKHLFPSLKELHISQMKKEQVLELSQHNPEVLVSGKIFRVKDVGLKTYKALNGSLIE
jgi:Leucine-rich repeat (LRR) protein